MQGLELSPHIEEGYYTVAHHNGLLFVARRVGSVWYVPCFDNWLPNHDVCKVVDGPYPIEDLSPQALLRILEEYQG